MDNENASLDISAGIVIGAPHVVVSAPAHAPTAMPTQAMGPLTREQVFAEVNRMTTDPTHPHYVGYRAGTQESRGYRDSLYRQLVAAEGTPQAPKVFDVASGSTIVNGEVKGASEASADGAPSVSVDLTGGVISDSLDDPREDAKFREVAARAIADELPMSLRDGAAAEAERLYSGEIGEALADHITVLTEHLAPKAKIRSHVEFARFAADLHELRGNPKGAPVALEQLTEAVDTELEKLGIDLDHVADMKERLFATKPELLQYFINHLNRFPAGSRVAAHVRACQALVTLSRLYQSVS